MTDALANDPVRRAKQALGRTGDFWALVDMARNIETVAPALAEIQAADEALRGHLRDLQTIRTELADRERAALAAESQASTSTADAKLARDRETMQATRRVNDLNLREEVIKSTELSLSQRETALAARESRLSKDAEEVDAKSAHDAKACESRWASLALAEMAFNQREAAFERRFAAAKAILAAVPDVPQADLAYAPGTETVSTIGAAGGTVKQTAAPR